MHKFTWIMTAFKAPIDQTIICEFPPDHTLNRWGLVAPRQTANAPEDLVSEGASIFHQPPV